MSVVVRIQYCTVVRIQRGCTVQYPGYSTIQQSVFRGGAGILYSGQHIILYCTVVGVQVERIVLYSIHGTEGSLMYSNQDTGGRDCTIQYSAYRAAVQYINQDTGDFDSSL
jgi:hypothetical protein